MPVSVWDAAAQQLMATLQPTRRLQQRSAKAHPRSSLLHFSHTLAALHVPFPQLVQLSRLFSHGWYAAMSLVSNQNSAAVWSLLLLLCSMEAAY
jgi:hypothetical protein